MYYNPTLSPLFDFKGINPTIEPFPPSTVLALDNIYIYIYIYIYRL